MHLLSSLRTFIHFILSVWTSVSFFLSFFCILGYNSLLLCIFYCSKKCCPLGLGSCVFFKKIFIYLSGCSRSRLQHSGSPCITQHLLSWQMDSLVNKQRLPAASSVPVSCLIIAFSAARSAPTQPRITLQSRVIIVCQPLYQRLSAT